MKNQGPIRRDPRQPRMERVSVVIPLTLLTISLGILLYCFHDAGSINEEVFVGAMLFIVAIPLGAIFAEDLGRRLPDSERGPGYTDGEQFIEVPPPIDVFTIWPLDTDSLVHLPSEQDLPSKERNGSERRER